jgi:four helix bundle protein
MPSIRRFEDLEVYNLSMDSAIKIFEESKGFPIEERYSLTDQIRRSSRSVCASIAEAWRKRRYPNAFVSKLSDADAEAAETQVWLAFAVKCGYLSPILAAELTETYNRICGKLVKMMSNPDDWVIRNKTKAKEDDRKEA